MSTYVPIQAITLTSAVASVTFTGIPQTFTDLVLVNSGTFDTSENGFALTFNSDTGSNYSTTYLYGNGTSALSLAVSNFSSINAGRLSTSFGVGITHIMNYTNRTTNKTVLSRGSSSSIVNANVGLWRGAGTPAITSLTATVPAGINNFAIGSTFTLYGIGSGAPKAFGGDEVRTDGTYWYHIFRSSGRFEPVQALSCDLLVVAGGGGGGNGNGGGGGGGAGGYRTSTGFSVPALTPITVTVGAGGSGGVNAGAGARGTSGGDSIFSTITSTGGGGGASSQVALTGGSGGGGNYIPGAETGAAGNTPSTSPSQGNAGGSNTGTPGAYGGGGGGGASAAGANGNSTVAGNGGAGTASSITGTSVTYAGGGGGGSNSTVAGGTGGAGGGGNGGNNNTNNATAGTANTGGGGGAGGGGFQPGKNGGSGIVVIRYAV